MRFKLDENFGTRTQKLFEGLGYDVETVRNEGLQVLRFNKGKYFRVNDLADVDGMVKKDYLDYLIGVDYTFFHKIDFNFQFMQRVIANHDNSMVDNRTNTSFSIWLKSGLFDNVLQPELFFVSSVDRQDWMLRPKISYIFRNKWTAALGVDIFEGKPNGTFGQFDNRDRAYIEVRRDF